MSQAHIDLYLYPNGETFWAVYVGGKALMAFRSFEAAARFLTASDASAVEKP